MGIKEDITEILFAIYKIPGEFAIGAIIAFAFWNAMKDITNWSIILFLLGIFFIILEVLTPILAGVRIYKKIFK
jgi:uncharacterized membrane protein (Fun14 family)